jgi:pentose-5-phosphate-3-epimerase
MEISALAGKPAPRNMLVDLAQLEQQYYEHVDVLDGHFVPTVCVPL